MKLYLAILSIITLGTGTMHAEPRVIPPHPSYEELAKKSQVATIVLLCKPNRERTGLEVLEVLKGMPSYAGRVPEITRLIPEGDAKALETEGYRELVFIWPPNAEGAFKSSSFALWPTRLESDGIQQFKFLGHDYSRVKSAVQGQKEQSQQGGARNP